MNLYPEDIVFIVCLIVFVLGMAFVFWECHTWKGK